MGELGLQSAGNALMRSSSAIVAGGIVEGQGQSLNMTMKTWWIDEPLLMAGSNPRDGDLARLRAQRFSVVVSFLEEKKQPPRYDKKSASSAGWTIVSIPIEEGDAPSLEQLSEFVARLRAFPKGTKILMHCESGLGRSTFIGAIYWVAKGLPASEAIARMQQAGFEQGWITSQRESLLHAYEQVTTRTTAGRDRAQKRGRR
jgi:protein-tyrosine phosphatase